MYSFGKAERFPRRNYTSACKKAFYDVTYQDSKSRAASIGYGKKFDFTKLSKDTPGPGKYKLNRGLSNISYSFGLGRDKIAVDGKLSNSKYQVKNPGPGKYPIPSTKSPVAFSFRIRHSNRSKSKDYVPGPGKYKYEPTLNSRGRYTLSKFRGSGAPVISTGKNSRFYSPRKNNNPAPGFYKDVGSINLKGTYSVSNLRSSACRTFGRAPRNTMGLDFRKMGGPGPGSYRLPSEFGHYVSSKASQSKFRKTMGNFKPKATPRSTNKKTKRPKSSEGK